MSLQIEVFDRTGKLKGRLGAFRSAALLDTFNTTASSSFAIDSRHPRAADLLEPGAMVRFETDGLIQTGWVNTYTLEGPSRAALLDFTVDSHFMLFQDVLGWVQPTRPIDQQGIAGDNAVYGGTTGGAEETIVKQIMRENALQRLGWPLEIPPSQGRGRQGMKVKMRFHPVYEKLFPVVDGAGLIDGELRWTIVFDPSTKKLVLDCAPVRTYPRLLTEQSGLAQWKVTSARPTATNVVIGGAGEAQMRDFRIMPRPGDDGYGRSAEWGVYRERFKDARDADGDPELMYRRGQESLDEGKAKAGISTTLDGVAARNYGTSLKVGDRVNVKLDNGMTFGPEILREARINYTRERGREVTPKIGDYDSNPDSRITKLVAAVARSIRKVVP